MLAWHLGGVIFLFRWIFRDPKVDLRLLALGAVIPDVIDLLIGGGEPFRQQIGHALVAPVAISIVIMVGTRRGRRRRMLMTVVVAWLFHLLLDGVWLRQQTFLWPFFGTGFAPWPGGSAWSRAWADPWRWIKELVGVIYLTLAWRRLGGPLESRSARA